jgi:hypothetical protein
MGRACWRRQWDSISVPCRTRSAQGGGNDPPRSFPACPDAVCTPASGLCDPGADGRHCGVAKRQCREKRAVAAQPEGVLTEWRQTA